MRDRTICFYSISTHLGGAERSLLELLQGLRSKPNFGFYPWVILPKSEGPLVDVLIKEKIPFDVVPMPDRILSVSRGAPLRSIFWFFASMTSVPGYFHALIKVLRQKKPDLIHTNAIKCHIIAVFLKIWVGVPVLWHLRDILRSGIALTMMRILCRFHGVYLVANSAASALPFNGLGKKVHVIHNGISLSKYISKPNRFFNRMAGISDDIQIVGILGVLARWKGHFEFIQMAKKLIESDSSACFVIIGDAIYDTLGDDGYKEELVREVRRLGLEKRIIFSGFQEDSVRALNGLDVLVHASIQPEPFGRVVIEAMACGVPVVCSAAGGVLEIVKEGENGFLFVPGCIEEMVTKVQSLLGSIELRQRLSAHGQASVKSLFTLERHVEQVVEIYRLILDSSSTVSKRTQ